MSKEIVIPTADAAVAVQGFLEIPQNAKSIVLFAHGSGSSRFSPRNQFVAKVLRDKGLATLLVDLLSPNEEEIDQYTREYRFDIKLLTDRLIDITQWLQNNSDTSSLTISLFGSSTGAAAALMAAASLKAKVGAVVSRGGRPDLVKELLGIVVSPTLLIVGSEDHDIIELNQEAYDLLTCEKKLLLIPGATHLFEEEGTLEQVADIAATWFASH